MSAKVPIDQQAREGELPGWQLYSDMFDSDRVYLELEGLVAEITMTGNMERAPGTVLLRLPAATSKQLCLVPKSRESPSAPGLAERLARSGEASTRLAKLGGRQPRMKGASGRRQDPYNTPAS